MRRWFAEPLVHFLLLGALIFAAYAFMADGEGGGEIVVTRGQQVNLIETFERTWRRPPTPEEFRGLVQDHVRQELAYREGTAMELDRNDIVIRRRLRQKLELLTEDIAALAPPTAAELDEYFKENPDKFEEDARYSFEHVYLSETRRGEQTESDAQALLGRIRSLDRFDPGTLGDPIALPASLDDATEAEVARVFGSDFAAQLADLPTGEWTGPVSSAFGLHLLRISSRSARYVPPFEEVEDEVVAEVLAQRRESAVAALYDALAAQYRITVEPLEPAPSDGASD